MKKILLGLSLIFISNRAISQNGLENIIVEKYYISDANDAAANTVGGVLPVGSTTYRIYVDMLPDYNFQAAFGLTGHELRLETSTLFFNNEDYGSTSPTFSKNNSRKNTVMLDSWLSVGAGCNGNFGVLKSEDNGVSTNVNNFSPLVLQNADPAAGIALTLQDGLLAVTGRSPKAVTAVGISTEIAIFNNQNDGTNGPVFSTTNGSWAALGGAKGADTVVNKVLIAQITTNGVFKFKLNIQIGTPSGGVEQYVAENPVGNEIQIPSLIFDSSLITDVYDNSTKTVHSVKFNPNPVTSKLNLEIVSSKPNTSTSNSFTITGVQGNTIMTHKLGALNSVYNDTIDLSSLSTGLYFITFDLDGTTITKKLIKK